MPRSLSRSPSYKRRRSPSPVSHRHSRRSRRDRDRSPYSRSHNRCVSLSGQLMPHPQLSLFSFVLPNIGTSVPVSFYMCHVVFSKDSVILKYPMAGSLPPPITKIDVFDEKVGWDNYYIDIDCCQ